MHFSFPWQRCSLPGKRHGPIRRAYLTSCAQLSFHCLLQIQPHKFSLQFQRMMPLTGRTKPKASTSALKTNSIRTALTWCCGMDSKVRARLTLQNAMAGTWASIETRCCVSKEKARTNKQRSRRIRYHCSNETSGSCNHPQTAVLCLSVHPAFRAEVSYPCPGSQALLNNTAKT